ncbi:MAG: hypothetical protein HZB47_02795 [Nitrosomonadales bacterium]|nr:hypothetical protein [Nitrosomonadales bacterium]
MRRLPRKLGWWVALGAVATAIVMAATPGEEGAAEPTRVAARAEREPARLGQQPETGQVELERLNRPQPKAGIGNAFGVTSWYVQPPRPAPPPAPPSVPTAPPLPFTYLGLYADAPTLLAILLKGERMYTVAEGEVIENTYRIERVTPGTVEMTYLPLNTRQTLSNGGGAL